jgi:acyl transferase domain-containing protein/NADPH:quinone reductase-like Zn-dependent oxidoreductase/acyl carrier protein
MDAGLDSLTATDLAHHLSKAFKLRLLPTLIFNYPTVDAIAAHMSELLGVTGAKAEHASELRDHTTQTDIAVVGTACRLPGDVNSVEALWEAVNCGRDLTSEVSPTRWDTDAVIAAVDSQETKDTLNRARYGGFLTNSVLESFRCDLFGISEAEASRMDPGQRLVLEVAYDALIDAGYERDQLKGQLVGVFLGASAGLSDDSYSSANEMSVYDATGKSLSVAAGRVSYVLGLQGPCSTVDTACSSSLVAMHQARRSLQQGECDVAIVVGMSILAPAASFAFAVAGMTSPDGKCHTFDEAANGYCRGEGCGAVVLKRMEDAVRDGDSIYAVVKGSAVMQDGKSASLTAPNGLAQQRLIHAALADANLTPSDVAYVESHGTGTKLGDPVETGALAAVYGTDRDTHRPLYVSGVKANVGHLEAASGMVGFLVALSALRYKQAPPNAQLQVINKDVAATVEGVPLAFPKVGDNAALIGGSTNPLSAAVSSFGFSGTIAHVILTATEHVANRRSSAVMREHNAKSFPLSPAYHRMLQNVNRESFAQRTVFTTRLHEGIQREWLNDHFVHGQVVLPGVGMVELAAAAGNRIFNSTGLAARRLQFGEAICLEGFTIARPIVVSTVEALTCTSLYTVVDDDGIVSLYNDASMSDAAAVAQGSARVASDSDLDPAQLTKDLQSYSGGAADVTVEEMYAGLSSAGLRYGDTFRLLRSVSVGEKSCKATIALSGDRLFKEGYLVPPPVLDAMLQATAFVVRGTPADGASQVPYSFDKVIVRPAAAAAMWQSGNNVQCLVKARSIARDACLFACTLFTASGEVVVHMDGAYTRAIAAADLQQTASQLPLELVSKLTPCAVKATRPIADMKLLFVCAESVIHDLEENVLKVASIIAVPLDGAVPDPIVADALAVVVRAEHLSAKAAPATVRCILRTLARGCDTPKRILLVSVQDSSRDATRSTVLAGIALTAQLEYPRCKFTAISVEENELLGAISNELQSEVHDIEVAYEEGLRLVRRYIQVPVGPSPWEIVLSERGSIDNLSLQPLSADHSELEADSVEIRVVNISLNFRDVLNVMGMYPGDPGDPGCEFAGTVVNVGKNVTSLLAGDEVLGIGSGCLKEVVRVPALMCHRKPTALSTAHASTVPIVFSTVELAFGELAKLKAGETVLVHAAAGGVGLAAIQYAQRVGARVVATASAGKQDYLRSLGIDIVSASRDADAFLADMRELGLLGKVDVVLNSLSDAFIPRSLDMLAPSGRFVEIGKRGIWSAEEVLARCPMVSYHVVALDDLSAQQPGRFQSLLSTVCANFDRGLCKPLPIQEFDFRTEFADAFSHLRMAAAVGKTVLHVPRGWDTMTDAAHLSEGSYIVTGGLGGLGLQTAKVLAQQGAKHIFVVSRSGKVSHEGQGLEEDLRWLQEESGAVVHILQCDVSDEAAVVTLLEQVRSQPGRIAGVFHCAGVIRDGTIRSQSAADGCGTVWDAKSRSAWYLHKHTLTDHVEHFVTFSSVTAMGGTIGQAVYGAANRYLDDLMRTRQVAGLPGLSVHWPLVADKGMGVSVYSAGSGDRYDINSAEFCTYITRILASPKTVAALSLLPAGLERNLSDCVRSQLRLVASKKSHTIAAARGASWAARVSVAKSKQYTAAEIRAAVLKVVTGLVNAPSGLSEEVQLMDQGLDSLGATDLANGLAKEFGVKLLPSLVFNHPSVKDIVSFIAGMLEIAEAKVLTAQSLIVPTAGVGSGDMAIVGISCRFPGDVNDLGAMWEMLRDGKDMTGQASLSRWDTDLIVANGGESRAVLDRVRYGGFLSDSVMESFRAQLFGISDAEATRMDPGQRLLLEVSYDACTDAGYTKTDLVGQKVGVFIGASSGLSDEMLSAGEGLSVFDATGKSLSVSAGRISYALGLQGPCFSTDTACSSSLVALHSARRSLQMNECSMAIVGGMSVLGAPASIAFAVAGMTSADGKCHTFDEAANGYCRGEGCGAVVLKRMEDAVRDGNNIYAVVKGSAVMQDGKSASLTAPNGLAQAALLRAALQDGGISAHDVSYIEAHGTGTKLGDPIETEAIAAVYGVDRPATNPLYVGGVKANIGHLEAASGIAGLIAAVLALRHSQVPPNAQLRVLNNKVAASVQDCAIHFPTTAVQLGTGKETYAGLSSFGYSGTIAHVILSSHPGTTTEIGCTASTFVMTTAKPAVPPEAWMFAGQGTLKLNALVDIYKSEESFRLAVDRCDRVLEECMGYTASETLYPASATDAAEAEARLNNTMYAQPVLVALEYALAEMCKAKGHLPAVVVGHSLGEYAAAASTGVLPIEDCLRLVCLRAQLVSDNQGCRGSMVAVRASRTDVETAIAAAGVQDRISLAAVNGALSAVVSGDSSAVQSLISSEGWSHRQLAVENAFHSPLMDCVADSYRAALNSMVFAAPSCTFISTVTGKPVVKFDAQYWIDHLLQPVLFDPAMRIVAESGIREYREVGPDRTLERLAQAVLKGAAPDCTVCSCVEGVRTELPRLAPHVVSRYPLQTRRHRMLQELSREQRNQCTVITCLLHAGILSDWLSDHVVHTSVVLPGAAQLELAFAAALRVFGGASSALKSSSVVRVEGLALLQPIVVSTDRDSPTKLFCALDDTGDFTIHITADGGGTESCRCAVRPQPQKEGPDRTAAKSSNARNKQKNHGWQACIDGFYESLRNAGLRYGPTFTLVHSVKREGTTCVGTLSIASLRALSQSYLLPASIIDCMLQASAVLIPSSGGPQVPYAFDNAWLDTSALPQLWSSDECRCVVHLLKTEPTMSVFDCTLVANNSDVVLSITGAYTRVLQPESLESQQSKLVPNSLSLDWKWESCAEPVAAKQLSAADQRLALVGTVDMLMAAEPLRVEISRNTGVTVELSDRILTVPADMQRYAAVVALPGCVSDVREVLELIEHAATCADSLVLLVHTQQPDYGDIFAKSLAGAVLSAQIEFPRLKMKVVCVEAAQPLEVSAHSVVAEVYSSDDELEVRYKNGIRYVKRYYLADDTPGLVEIELTQRGSLTNLRLHRTTATSAVLRDDEVEVRMAAVSLNFRDVLNVLGMYPGDPGAPGCEFAGVVTQVGSTVTAVHVGDEVLGLGSGCLKEVVRVNQLMVPRKPSSLNMAAAATVPIVYCTVQLALASTACLQAGQTVLIHAAAGGVGLAAIQYAQRVGARVVATASAGKHAYLRSIGVELISTSRDAAQFREDLVSMGLFGKVDVVLNSLTDEYIPTSLDALAEGGEFVEIGKRGIWSSEEVQARRAGVQYSVLALDEMSAADPKRFASLLAQVCADFESGYWKPLPVHCFDFESEYLDAFRTLKSGENVGKVVLTQRPAVNNAVAVQGGAFVVTGGLGGLGLQTAKVLAQEGANHIFLVSRSGKVSHEGQGLEEDLRWLQEESGAQVYILQCDVSVEAAVSSMLSTVRTAAGHSFGLIHCAGIVRDGLIRGGKCAADSADVWRAKAASAWWLHQYTMSDDLSCFIALSSVTSAVGTLGQAAYGAANRYLEELVQVRNEQGFPGTCLRLPAVVAVGMGAEVARSDATKLHTITKEDYTALLLRTLQQPQRATRTVLPKAALSGLGSHVTAQFSRLQSAVKSTRALRSTKSSAAGARTAQQQVTLDETYVVVRDVVASLMQSSGGLSDSTQLMEAGLDSLSATDLAGTLSAKLGVQLLPTLIFNHSTIADIVQHIGGLLGVTVGKVSHDAVTTRRQDLGGDMAIVGVSCRFPGDVNSLDELWEMLQSKRDATSEVSLERWDADALAAMLSSGADSALLDRIRFGGFLSDKTVESFRAVGFGISAAEASRMDPGQRLLLDVSYDALRDAGYDDNSPGKPRTGVFVGASGTMGGTAGGEQQASFFTNEMSAYDATGSSLSVAAGRISYALGLQGPCFTSDTACSSSLVALHNARRSLQFGDCDTALVASVSFLTPSASVAFAVAGMTSPDGKCHTFDEAANGYCRGEGCGALVLKRMEDAVRDGDSIYAVVKGSAVMQDGKSASLTAPNGLAQELMLKKALSDARLSPTDVCVVESHGTGTKLGDPIETGALVSVYSQERTADNPLYMSGVKANIGHLEAASGMAGLFALMLSLRHKRVPPNAQLKSLNEKIALTVDGHPVLFPTESTPVLRPAGRPMVGAVSSLGYSGTIAHVILAEPTVQARDMFSPVVEHSETKSALWMFGGQGTLSLNVARILAETDEAFKAALERCDAVLLNLTGRTASSILYPAATATPDEALATLNSTQFAQPVLVILEYCLMQRLLALGHRPVAVIGHSLGEYAAAVAAGVVTIEDCLRLVCLRAKLVEGCEQCRGSMVAVRASSSDAQKAIEASGQGELVSVAAVNGTSSTVLSGDATAVQRVLAASQWSSRALNVMNAFHSPLMNSIVAEYHAILDEMTFSQPVVPFFSTVTGQEATAAITTTQYWVDHLLQPVLFKDALTEAAARGHSTFFEVGADTSLTKLARSVLGAGKWAFVDSKDILLSHAPSTVDATEVTTRYPMGVTPHRMVQSISREAFAERTVVTCRLHSRILNDWLADHVVHDNIILPGAALLEMALAVAGRYYSPNGDLASSGADWLCVSGFSVTQPVVVTDVRSNLDPQSTAEWLPTTTLTAAVDYAGNVEVFGAAGNDTQRTLHMQACIGAKFGSGLRYGECGGPDWSSVRAAAQHAGMSCDKVELGSDLYKSFAACGLKLGSTFQLLAEARCSPDKCIGKLNITNLHPWSQVCKRLHDLLNNWLDRTCRGRS